MISVLITRPASSADSLAQALEHLGYRPIIAPLLDIHPTGAPYPAPQNVQAIMITSSNALAGRSSKDKDIEPLLSLPCFCVGTQTTQKVRAFGFIDVHDANGDWHHLTDMICNILTDRQATILHISGRHISSDMHHNLNIKGYSVVLWPTYEALPKETLSIEAISNLRQSTLDVVLVYSQRTAEILCQLITDHKLQACCQRVMAIGLSQAVLETLETLPWRQCISASVPTEDAMIASLQKIYPATRGSP